jgi:hypothetical protein
MSRDQMQRPVISLGTSLLLFWIGNIFNWPLPCEDCFQQIGWPFHYYNKGGFAGGAGYEWPGLVGDLLIIAIVAVITAWVLGKISNRGQKPLREKSNVTGG